MVTRPLSRALAGDGFVWLTGIEDTFVLCRHPVTGRHLDEYELTGHYDRWRSDLDLAAELGIGAMRYGLPWHRINPARGVWDFTWADGPIEHLLALGIQPIVDLVHYGVPAWIEDAFLHPDYDRYVAEYAGRVAERYGSRVNAYTPLNEPRITAWYAGKLGWWPPFRRGWTGFLQVLLAACRGIVRTEHTLRALVPDLLSVHVDAADSYVTDDPALVATAERFRDIGFLALDLVNGKVDETHPLRSWLIEHGVETKELDALLQLPARPDAIGVNLYPLFSRKVLRRSAGRTRMRMPYASADIVIELLEAYHRRYALPVLISETASEGPVARRRAWLEASVHAVASLRARGVPVVGYTWWPMFALVAWAYRQGKKPLAAYLKQMGLWDLTPTEGQLARAPTPLVAAYRDLALNMPLPPVARLSAAAPPKGTLLNFAALER